MPQTRNGEFYPHSLSRGLRSERALLLAIAEMYVQGVSTRRVQRIVEELCGTEVSSTQVSRASAELDEMLTAWRCRDLGCYRCVVLDAQYEKVRRGGQVLDAAVLFAYTVSTRAATATSSAARCRCRRPRCTGAASSPGSRTAAYTAAS